ncbi:MAG: DUF2304 family protein [Candidatus Micrarchaeia archaeon]
MGFEFETIMGLMSIQLIGLALALLLMYYSFIQYRKGLFDVSDLTLWGAIWIGLLFASVFPGLLSPLLRPFAFIRVLDFLVISSILALFILSFLIYRKVVVYQRKTEKLVKLLALKRKK